MSASEDQFIDEQQDNPPNDVESSNDEDEAAIEDNRKQFTEDILQSVDRYMDSKTSRFEKKMEKMVQKSSDATVKRATKKMKLETPDLVRPGCRDQFQHNLAVLERIEAAENHLREAEIREALQELDEGKKIVLKRQKIVQLADREEDGWAFVKEYQKDELASGSDDEKHMSKARTASARKSRSRDTRRYRSYRTRQYPSYTAAF